jgi:hypothetical protein
MSATSWPTALPTAARQPASYGRAPSGGRPWITLRFCKSLRSNDVVVRYCVTHSRN